MADLRTDTPNAAAHQATNKQGTGKKARGKGKGRGKK